jgi:hypothetical protein
MHTVCLTTLWPHDPGARSEDFVLREFLREYFSRERDWALRVVVASAHREAVEAARGVLAEFPSVRAEFWWLETAYAGSRPEEISYGKEQVAWLLSMLPGWDWLFFFDADVWTRIAQVPEWIRMIGAEKDRCFVQIKYTVRTRLVSPAPMLGAFFHHRELLLRLEYWRVIFPRNAEGRRMGAPDCWLHEYLLHKGCRKMVPPTMRTLHFKNRHDAQGFDSGRCFLADGARDAKGDWSEASQPWRTWTIIHRILAPPPVRSQEAIASHAALYPRDFTPAPAADASPQARANAASLAHAQVMRRFLDGEADFAVVLEEVAIVSSQPQWLGVQEFDLFIPFRDDREHLPVDETIRHGVLPESGGLAYLCSREFARHYLSRLQAGEVCDQAHHQAAAGLRKASFAGNSVYRDHPSGSLISEERRRFVWGGEQ